MRPPNACALLLLPALLAARCLPATRLRARAFLADHVVFNSTPMQRLSAPSSSYDFVFPLGEEDNGSIALSDAMVLHGVAASGIDPTAAAALFCYFDEDDASIMHGPYPLSDILSWADDGFFEPSNIIFPEGNRSEGITVREAAAAAGLGQGQGAAASGAALSGDGTHTSEAATEAGEQRSWYYPDEENPEMMHGPFTLHELHDWYLTGALGAGEALFEGESPDSAAVAAEVHLLDALVAAGITTRGDDAWYYYTEDSTMGPFSLAELKEWKSEAHFEGDLPVFRAGDLPVSLESAIQQHAVVADVQASAMI